MPPRPQIKDEKTYNKLREQGQSKEKSARIANAAAARGRSSVGRKGGKSPSYDEWTKQDSAAAGQGDWHQGPLVDEQGGTGQGAAPPLTGARRRIPNARCRAARAA